MENNTNNNKMMMWILIVVAFIIGGFAGYFVERTRAISVLNSTKMVMQKEIDDTKAMLVTPTAMQPEVVMMKTDPKLGSLATDTKGMTLYTYSKDTANKSNCTGTCATTWPPYVVTGTVATTLPAHLSTTKRADGAVQYTWDGKPLYFYSGDKKAGDATGNGVGGVWFVAK